MELFEYLPPNTAILAEQRACSLKQFFLVTPTHFLVDFNKKGMKMLRRPSWIE